MVERPDAGPVGDVLHAQLVVADVVQHVEHGARGCARCAPRRACDPVVPCHAVYPGTQISGTFLLGNVDFRFECCHGGRHRVGSPSSSRSTAGPQTKPSAVPSTARAPARKEPHGDHDGTRTPRNARPTRPRRRPPPAHARARRDVPGPRAGHRRRVDAGGRPPQRRRGPRPQPDAASPGSPTPTPSPWRRSCCSPARSATATAGGARCSSASCCSAAGSLLSAFADSGTQLIAFRALTGLGGALIMPGTLSTITSVFPPEERARAVGIWAGFAGAGGTLGMLAVGLDARHVLVAVDLLRDRRGLRASPSRSSSPSCRPAGPTSTSASTRSAPCCRPSASAPLVLGIIEGPIRGWTEPLTVGALVAGAVLAVGVRALGAADRAPAARPAAVPLPRLRRRLGLAARAVHRPVRAVPGDPAVPAADARLQRAEGGGRPAAADLPDDPDLGRRPRRCRCATG